MTWHQVLTGIPRDRHPYRQGIAAVEVVMVLAVTLSIALVLYATAKLTCSNLHHVISAIVGSPYL